MPSKPIKNSNGWDKVSMSGVLDDTAYALEITGDSMLPVYREGDIIIVSPKATVRNGDRVVGEEMGGQGDVAAGELVDVIPFEGLI